MVLVSAPIQALAMRVAISSAVAAAMALTRMVIDRNGEAAIVAHRPLHAHLALRALPYAALKPNGE